MMEHANNPAFEPLLSSKDASKLLHVHPQVLERWARWGEVPAFKVGRSWRYRASALDSWIQKKIERNAALSSQREPEL